MELINNIKKRFNKWFYNIWVNIGKKHKWHYNYSAKPISQIIEKDLTNKKK